MDILPQLMLHNGPQPVLILQPNKMPERDCPPPVNITSYTVIDAAN
jgi:hypothetical protein